MFFTDSYAAAYHEEELLPLALSGDQRRLLKRAAAILVCAIVLLCFRSAPENHPPPNAALAAVQADKPVPTPTMSPAPSSPAAPKKTIRRASTALAVFGGDIPPNVLALYKAAPARWCPGLDWGVLAGMGYRELNHGRHPQRVSPKGAEGFMQFMPRTWAAYGVDGNNDGRADPFDPEDAIPSAAHYLCRNGALRPGQLPIVLMQYNGGNVEQARLHKPKRYAAMQRYAAMVIADAQAFRQRYP